MLWNNIFLLNEKTKLTAQNLKNLFTENYGLVLFMMAGYLFKGYGPQRGGMPFGRVRGGLFKRT